MQQWIETIQPPIKECWVMKTIKNKSDFNKTGSSFKGAKTNMTVKQNKLVQSKIWWKSSDKGCLGGSVC